MSDKIRVFVAADNWPPSQSKRTNASHNQHIEMYDRFRCHSEDMMSLLHSRVRCSTGEDTATKKKIKNLRHGRNCVCPTFPNLQGETIM